MVYVEQSRSAGFICMSVDVHQPKNPLRKGHILLICLPIYVCAGILLALIFSIAAPCFSQGIPSLNNSESTASKKTNGDESIELPGSYFIALLSFPGPSKRPYCQVRFQNVRCRVVSVWPYPNCCIMPLF